MLLRRSLNPTVTVERIYYVNHNCNSKPKRRRGKNDHDCQSGYRACKRRKESSAFAAADSVLIPVQAQYLPAKGLEQLLQTIRSVRENINPKLRIDGILLTMVDSRTNYAKETGALLRDTYGGRLKVFDTDIPMSVRAAETSALGKSIFDYDPNGKVAAAYKEVTREVMQLEKSRQKHKSDLSR